MHPLRQTGLLRLPRPGRSVGSHCLDCAKAAQPDLKTRARFWSAKRAAAGHEDPDRDERGDVHRHPALVGRSRRRCTGAVTNAHLDLGLSREVLEQQITWQGDDGTLFVTEPDGWYRLVTSGFLHFGIVHIGLNMFFLYVLGPMLEPALGRVRFLLLYLAVAARRVARASSCSTTAASRPAHRVRCSA